MDRIHHKRFHGIRYAFILTAAAVFLWGTGGSALAAESVELKLAHFMSPLHVQHQESFLPFAQNVEKLTQGRVRIKVYAGGALGGLPIDLQVWNLSGPEATWARRTRPSSSSVASVR